MKKLSIKDVRKLYNDSISTVFNDRVKNIDIVDSAKIHEILLAKGITEFYFTVGLQFIEKYLNEISK